MSVSTMPSPMGQAAIQYARRGWPVFPCRERAETRLIGGAGGKERTFSAKAPYTGKGLNDATTHETTIAAWWREHPEALIGLPTGANGCFVLDFDPRVEEDVDPETGEVTARREWTLEQLKADLEVQMGCALPVSVTAVTQSGGVHVYFRQPAGEPIRNRGNLPAHVDVRGLGGYVIAPPSVMVETGARYRWLDRGDWRDDAAIVEAPAALIDILRARKERAAPAARTAAPITPGGVSAAVDDDVRKYALSALDGECRAIRSAGSGQRNAQLNESAFKVATLVAAGAIDAGVARGSVEAAGRDNPGRDDAGQIAATIDSGWTAGLQSPRDLAEIAAASRSRRERGPRASSRPAPDPRSDDDGEPSSHSGGGAVSGPGRGAGRLSQEAMARECAFLPLTDLGNAERFQRRFGADFTWVPEWGWLAWDGTRWNREMADALVQRAVYDTVRGLLDEAELVKASGRKDWLYDTVEGEAVPISPDRAKGRLDYVVKVTREKTVFFSDTIRAWGRTSEGAGHLACIARLAQPWLTAKPADFDADPLRVNLSNGTLVLERPSGSRPARARLRPFDRADRITKMANVAFDREATCPQWDRWFAQMQPAEDMRHFLDCWAGYNMTGDISEQKMALFYGLGANGKSTWVDTVAWMIGDYSRTASIETFIEVGGVKRRGDSATPDLAALAGARLVRASEPEEGAKFSDGLIKAMTSGEPMNVRELNKGFFELAVTFKVTVSANVKPKIGTDHGIQRRVRLVPWEVTISDGSEPGTKDERDLKLVEKLKVEAPGILNRIIAGALSWLTDGLPEPEAVRAATREYQEENDPLKRFIELCIVKRTGSRVGSTALHELFAAWQVWAGEVGANGKAWSQRYLTQQLKKKGFAIIQSNTMMWLDIETVRDRSDFVDEQGRAVASSALDMRPPHPPPGWGDDDLPP